MRLEYPYWSPGFLFQFLIIELRGFSLGSYSFSTILCSAELVFKERDNYNNVTLKANSSQSGNHMTNTNYKFTSSDLTSITVLGSFLSMPRSKWRLFLSHLCHRVSSTFIYNSKGYSVRRVLSMIQDDKK